MDARAEATTPPKKGGYLPVQELPPAREKPAMTADERAKLLKDLTTARDRQTSQAKAKEGAGRPKPAKP